MPTVIAVPREVVPGERRIATVPEVVAKWTRAGHEDRVDAGAGTEENYPDAAFLESGAKVVPDLGELLAGAGIVLTVQPPRAEVLAPL
ncbi:MAG: NAD(P)(+) transhydrogenase (Re/Si-specific) subunit alpha, partial [Thermoplasmata archaeon]